MKRRQFGVLAGSSLAAAGILPVEAQAATADPSLLTTTLTPYGAERAGNADGSIPPWTGGLVSPPTTGEFDVLVFTDEKPLYTVDAGNLAQYAALVTPGLQEVIKKFGFSLLVYPTHRTAAAPQYVYDNIAKNVTRASLNPAGGRFGFSGGYGGIPFPILDTSDPYVAGAQLIWNTLTHWEGASNWNTFTPALVISGGKSTLSTAEYSQFYYPYYDPNGSPETYDGYYSKLHGSVKAPPTSVGQETLTWHSTDVTKHPDITWTLLNGQGRVRKAPDEAYDAPNPSWNDIANIDESQGFYGNPSKYDWKYLGKQEMLIAYNCNSIRTHDITELCLPNGLNPAFLRFEKHRVYVVEATLHPGERNVLPRRTLYLDEDTMQIVMGESYDGNGAMTRFYMNPLSVKPSVPMVNPVFVMVMSLVNGDYVVNGDLSYGAYKTLEYEGPLPSSDFDAEQMAAGASF